MTHTQTITNALSQALANEPAPGLMSPELAGIMSAIRQLTDPEFAATRQGLRAHAQIGVAAIELMLNHLNGSMIAQRTMAVMRAKGGDLC